MDVAKQIPAVRIVLGTTLSVIAHLNDVVRAESIPNAEGDLRTSSVVLHDGDEAIVGRETAKARATELENIAVLVPRHTIQCRKESTDQWVAEPAPCGFRMSLTISTISWGGGGVTAETTAATVKLTIIPTKPMPSGEIPNGYFV